jgi:hydrogenase expression/formation protein HypC
MCLSVPAKIVSIQGEMAVVSIGGVEVNASIQLMEKVEIGDYVLLHAGFAIQKLNEEEANETFRLLKELEDAGKDLYDNDV